MKNIDTELHVRGRSQFLDDLPVPEGTLHAAVFSSPIAHGEIIGLDVSAAERMDGIHGIFTAGDIPGENQIGNVITDEPLFAAETVLYAGQPIAVVAGESAKIARAAARAMVLKYRELPATLGAREAYARGQLVSTPISSSLGNVEETWGKCHVVVEGRADTGAQEHVYLETQRALAWPTENGGVKIVSSTQFPGAVQQVAARVLGVPMHHVEVDVQRLGGGFGGKQEQANPWAAMAALVAFRLKRPVKLILLRDEDMRMTGKRNPYSSDFRIGVSREGKILAYRVTLYQNAGAVADLSPPVMDRALFHATHSYFVPNVHATGICCRTNLPPNTAFRGFGVPQAAFVMEAAICQAAEKLGVDPSLIQEKNLLQEGDPFHFGMKVENARAARCWEEAEKTYEKEALYRKVLDFNRENSLQKKGLAMMPICFGIAFDKAVFFNQGYALAHVYNDGSVGVSTGAVEMGQGVSTKIRQVAAHILSIPAARIKIESVNTTRIANASPTVASFGADLNGHATRLACREILNRLKQFAARRLEAEGPDDIEIRQGTIYVRGQPESTWNELIFDAYFDRINLSAQAHYATPHVHFDENKNKGRPYAYHVFGAALIEATVDCLRGTYRIDSVKAVHDFGKSLNPLIDLGQAEGAIAQGIGWMTMEEILHDENGRLLSDTLSSYKIPDIYSTPEIAVSFLENPENPLGIFHSKAVGEPPLLYGIGAWFAILQAMKAFRPDIEIAFSAPMTPEKVLLSLYNEPEIVQDGSHV